MINVTVTYTDNLGPEADIPGLLRKIAARWRRITATSRWSRSIGALRLTDFVVGERPRRLGRRSPSMAALPADRLEELRAGCWRTCPRWSSPHLVNLYGGGRRDDLDRTGAIRAHQHGRPHPCRTV